MDDRKEHWEKVYTVKGEADVSWYQPTAAVSLDLIRVAVPSGGRVLDVGGGASMLVDRLLDSGGYDIAVLDIAEAALAKAKGRLGPRAERVKWLRADITADPDLGQFDLWHDRAVFHFLTDRSDRQRYVSLLTRSVPPGGHVIIATFALDGPTKCSGLEVARYDGPSLARELGPGLALMKTVPEVHVTPWGAGQSFQYSVFTRTQEASP
jgi:SAM-dependent methyltransferase